MCDEGVWLGTKLNNGLNTRIFLYLVHDYHNYLSRKISILQNVKVHMKKQSGNMRSEVTDFKFLFPIFWIYLHCRFWLFVPYEVEKSNAVL